MATTPTVTDAMLAAYFAVLDHRPPDKALMHAGKDRVAIARRAIAAAIRAGGMQCGS